MHRSYLALAAMAAILPITDAHYNFESPIVNSQETAAYQYVRRTVNSNSPIIDSNDLRCNAGGNDGTIMAATQTYTVAAGSQVGFKMNEYIGHTGPLAVYMSRVPSSQTAQSYLGDGDWLKIYELTTATETDTEITWASFIGGGIHNFTVSLPSNLPAGEYLMREEHIAIHGASEFGGAQFYMGCAQLKVTGSGSGTPAPTVKFPRAYTGYEPGILFNPYWPPLLNYTAPGPVTWPNACEDHTSNLNGRRSDGDCTPLLDN